MRSFKAKLSLDKDTYSPGEIVRGVLSLYIFRPCKLLGLDITFLGRSWCEVKKSSVGYTQKILTRSELLHVRGEEMPTVTGLYTFNIEYEIPEGIPAPCKVWTTWGRGAIEYGIFITVKRPWFWPDNHQNHTIKITPTYSRTKTEMAVCTLPSYRYLKYVEQVEKGKVYVNASLLSTIVAPGEVIVGNVDILNSSRFKIRRIIMSLDRFVILEDKWEERIPKQMFTASTSVDIGKMRQGSFELCIPLPVDIGMTIPQPGLVSVRYEVSVMVYSILPWPEQILKLPLKIYRLV